MMPPVEAALTHLLDGAVQALDEIQTILGRTSVPAKQRIVDAESVIHHWRFEREPPRRNIDE